MPISRHTMLWHIKDLRPGLMPVEWLRGALTSLAWQPLHHVLVTRPGADETLISALELCGVEVSVAPLLSKATLEVVNPAVVVLVDPDGVGIEKSGRNGQSWNWLTNRWMTLSVHCSVKTPWIPGADADLFLTETLKRAYGNLEAKMTRCAVISPCIPTRRLASSSRSASSRSDLKIMMVPEPDDTIYPRQLFDELAELSLRLPGERRIVVTVHGSEANLERKTPGGRRLKIEFKPPPSLCSKPVDFERTDIFVHYNESGRPDLTGRMTAAAMAAGIPVIATAGGAAGELVDNGGLIVPADRIVRSIEALADDPMERMRLGMMGRGIASASYDQRRFADTILPLYIKYTFSL